jgi:uncharacterized protein (TIGR03437 family)
MASFCSGQGFTINTVAGDGVQGFTGDNGLAINAEIFAMAGLGVDGAGNIYIADSVNSRIRKVATNGIITTVAGTATAGYSGDNGPATAASLSFPTSVVVDTAGNLYIADAGNFVIRKIDTHGIITTFAGTGSEGFSGDGGPAVNAQLDEVNGLAFDAAGNLYLADSGNQRIRKIASDGAISTIAGTGVAGFTGGGGPAIDAEIYAPNSVAFDAAGILYFTEPVNNTIRKISTSGIITTVAGQGFGNFGSSGDGGPAINALLNDPHGVVVDSAGNLYFTDEDNQRIRMISASGIITTIAGNGVMGFAGDGGPAANSEINEPYGVALGPTGVLYFVDSGNKRVRALIPAAFGQPPAITQGGVVSASAFGEFTAISPGDWIEIYGTNLALGTNTWSSANFNGTTAPTSLNGTSVTIGNASAFVEYADPGHINVQVPSNIPAGPQQLIVITEAGVSAQYTVSVNATEPGLLAPASFVIAGGRYVAALFSDGVTYVLPPGAIAGVPSRRAQPGDIITLYGVGFGPVVPPIPAGQIAQQSNALTSGIQVFLEQTPAATLYAGLAPGAVGLYQINVVVPSVPASDTTLLTFTLGGVPGTQSLYIAVQ